MSFTHEDPHTSYQVNRKARIEAQRVNDSSRKRRFGIGLRSIWYREYRKCRFSARLGFIERSMVQVAVMQWRSGSTMVHTGYTHVSQVGTLTETNTCVQL